ALARAGLQPRDLPLFLVLGRPEGPMNALFQAAKLQFVVKQTPGRPDAPLHVFATRDAIYVSCQGCSLMGKHADLLAADTSGTGASAGDIEMPEDDDALVRTVTATLMAGGKGKGGADSEVEEYIKRIQEQRRAPTPEERRKMRGLVRQ